MRLKGETSVLFIARTRTQVTIVRSSENSQEKWDRVLNSRVAYWTFPRQHHRTLGMLRVDRSLSIDLLMKSLRLITEPLSIKKSDTWGHRVNPDRIYILHWSSFSNIYMHVCMFKSRSRLLAKLRIVLLYHRELFPSPLGTWHCFWKKRKKNTHLNETIDAKFNILMRSPCWVNRERLTAIINWFYRFFFCRNVSAL